MRKGFLSVCSLLHLHCLKESLAREVHRQYSWNEWQGDGSRAPSSVSDLDDGCPQLFPFLFLCSMFQCLSGFSRVPSWKYFHPRTTESVSIIYWGWCVQGPTDPDRARLEPRPLIHSLGSSCSPFDQGVSDAAQRCLSLFCTDLHFLDEISGLGLQTLISRWFALGYASMLGSLTFTLDLPGISVLLPFNPPIWPGLPPPQPWPWKMFLRQGLKQIFISVPMEIHCLLSFFLSLFHPK